MMRSSLGRTQDNALSSVVLPLPVPPETAIDLRARTAHVRHASMISSIEPAAFIASSVIT